MRILLTNHRLAEHTGSELYLRDVALALLAHGHQPIVYSRRLGALAAALRRATVPVLDDLDQLAPPPDLIHAQHHLEAMTALARFPHTPAIYLCHGWLPAEEAPPRHPRIRRYVAVDELVRQRLCDECGIPAAQTRVVLNFVDLERFRQRPPLPARPQRALVFSNYASEANHLPLLREVCAGAGLALDVVGFEAGYPSNSPEQLLGDYDVVFAKGRSALEAAAVGAAVIVCGVAGLGPMVTASELDRLRAFNFGVRLLQRPVTVEGVAGELRRYDPMDATAVTQRLRREAGLDLAIADLIQLYTETLAEHRASPPPVDEEALAMARYLRWGPLVGGDFFQHERELLKAEIAHAKAELAARLASAEQARVRAEERVQVETVRATLAEQRLATAQRDAEQRRVEDAQDNTHLHRELAWIKSTVTWRWREQLLNQRWLVALYRLFGRAFG